MCVEKVCKCFEQNLVSSGIIPHIFALGVAIDKINEKKEIPTNNSVYFVPKMRYSKGDCCIRWYRPDTYSTILPFPLSTRSYLHFVHHMDL
jgi:hypothetical protein